MAEQEKHLIGRAYLAAIPLVGVGLVAWSVREASAAPPSPGWFLLTVATALTGAYTLKIPGLVVRLSLSEPTVFLSTLLYGPAAGTLTAAVDALVMSLRLIPRLRTPHRVLFNVGALAASVYPASLLFFGLSGLSPREPDYGPVESFVGPLYAFALAVFFLNSGIVAVALGVERRSSPLTIWLQQFPWLSANYLASASIAAILVVFSRALDFGLIVLLLPLIVVSFLAFRTTLGRLDDANVHLSEVNRLYLSTIETLAMAIDAKDQVTHGHIRRVQRFAVGLARSLGVTEERQLKAIEAAALLHDMGKLAIPEFILNKPGKLTTREFSVMKTHAAVGADLLSSIQFPYPVVPIVRHHHENWDGTGYPDGLRGSDIPIGARILSVVDCYDALTSDRPYRPALATTTALEILSQRRGRMYDPLVVDAFIRDHAALCAAAELQHLPSVLLPLPLEPTEPQISSTTEGTHAAPTESLRVLASLAPYPDALPLGALCSQVIGSLRGIARFDAGVVFTLDEVSNTGVAVYAEGTGSKSLSSLSIPVGERLTGWVFAHKTPVWNSDAALDLGGTEAGHLLAQGSSLPLLIDGQLACVLTLYGRGAFEFTVGQRRAVESLLPSIAAALGPAMSRPAIAIDCTEPSVRTAALGALDALLSHDRDANSGARGSVVSITLSSIGQNTSSELRVEVAGLALSAVLSPRGSTRRCVLRLTPDTYLLCALDGATTEALESEIEEAKALRALKGLALSTVSVTSSLELLSSAQAALNAAATQAPSPRQDRVH